MKRSRIVYKSKRTSLRKKSKLKQKFFGGLFFCLIISLVYFFIFSPVCWIEDIKVRGVGENSSIVQTMGLKILEEKIFNYIPQRSILLAPAHQIQARILETFPEIKSVSIQKKWPRTLEIKIEERESIGIWCQKKSKRPANSADRGQVKERVDKEDKELIQEEEIKKCFYIDDQGVIYQEAPMMQGGLILTIVDSREKSVNLREKVLSIDLINFILEIKKQLSEKLDLLTIKFEINSIHDLVATTSEDWRIYFDPSHSSQNQIRVLERVLEEEIKENRIALEYIDLRIENRAYYK